LIAEIKDDIKIEYDWPEIINLIWNVLEQMYGQAIARNYYQVL
jgi:hypothetical protein